MANIVKENALVKNITGYFISLEDPAFSGSNLDQVVKSRQV